MGILCESRDMFFTCFVTGIALIEDTENVGTVFVLIMDILMLIN
jgi:hypothetical protein